MELTKAIQERRSIRKFEDSAISKESLHTIIQAGIAAPSAKNRQPWRFVVVQGAAKAEMIAVMERGMERERKAPLLPGSSQHLAGAKHTAMIMAQAPITIFVVNPLNEMTYPNNFEEKIYAIANIQSVGACIQNMLLAAVDLDIGSLWICDIFFAYPELYEWLGVQGQIVAAVSLGVPAENPQARPRHTVEKVTQWK